MAGRKNKYTVDYFPHYCSNESKTMFILENKFGLIGYAVWFKTLELLGKSEHHYIDLRDETDRLFLISKLKITEEKFIEIYNLLAKLNAIDLELWNHKIVFSDNFVSNVEDAYARRKGINVLHKYDICEHLLINIGQKLPNKSKVNKSKVNKTVKLHFTEDIFNCYDGLINYFPDHLQPKDEKTKTAWLSVIEKLNRIDKIPFDIIIKIVKKTRADEFWSANFLSLMKLRKKDKNGIMYVVIFNEKIKSKSKKSINAGELIRERYGIRNI